MVNPAIFRAYDIRGNGTADLNYEIAYKIGFCFSKMILNSSNNKICIGRDGRLSSPELYEGLVHGIYHAGGEIISIGIVPTPILYFADKQFKPASSIMITGSHNPKDDNGFKIIAAGKSFFDQQLQQLMREVQRITISFNSYKLPNEIDINSKYVEKITSKLNFDTKIKIAWDAGNGAAGNILELLQNKLPNENVLINNEIDGNFPNHHPDPSVEENLLQLIDIVRRQSCDFGIAFDGDADRVGIVSKSGKVIHSDQLLCLFARDVLRNNPGSTIIADVKTSDILFSEIKNHGGVPLMWKTGHSWIKNKMHETGALLAGEMSGHIFFADHYYGYDDGIYAALRFIDLISRSDKDLEQMLADLPIAYATPEIKIKIKDEKKFLVIEKIQQQLKEQNIEFISIDGVRVNTENGWWLLRASNTGAYLIARAESYSPEGLKILQNDLSIALENHNLKIQFGDH